MNVEKLFENFKPGYYFRDEPKPYQEGFADGVKAALAAMNIPDRYVPREEVTEGWYFAQMVQSPLSDREVVQCIGDDLLRIGDRSRWEIEDFTDFLPVPAWLLEGIGT